MPHKAGRRVAGHLRVLAAVREAQRPTPGLCQMAAALSVRGAQQKVLQDAGATTFRWGFQKRKWWLSNPPVMRCHLTTINHH